MVLSSKMPDFELEPVRLSSQDKTLDEKFAGNLQREERQPETEFNQVVGGVLAPSGSTSSSSPKSTWGQRIEDGKCSNWRSFLTQHGGDRGRWRRGKVSQRKGWKPFFTFGLGPHFSWLLAGESESYVSSLCDLLGFCVFVSRKSDTMWPGRTAKTCYECLRGENK